MAIFQLNQFQLAFAQQVDRPVHNNLLKPEAKCGILPKILQLGKGIHKSFLQHIFCFGNILLYLTRTDGLPDSTAKIYSLASLLLGILLVILFHRVNEQMKDASTPAARLFKLVTKGYADGVAARMANWLYKGK